ncbi:MAG: hypothetical protein Q8O29_11695 [Polaromonas sp.]|nr:hypothetical protein [Polaromonas sp.]MDP2818911.1 hypothetical protein [Polaromonas sp.]
MRQVCDTGHLQQLQHPFGRGSKILPELRQTADLIDQFDQDEKEMVAITGAQK